MYNNVLVAKLTNRTKLQKFQSVRGRAHTQTQKHRQYVKK